MSASGNRLAFRATLPVCLLPLLCPAVYAQGQDAPAGRNLVIIVGASPGAGYDIYSRVIGRHIRKHLPGNPTVVVQNMPGAGSKLAAEHIALIAPKDGFTIASVFPGAIAEPLVLDRTKWRYDPTKLQYIGTANSGVRLCATRTQSPVRTFEEARTTQSTMGAAAPGDSTFDYPTMLNNLAGTKFKVVSGYKGTQDIAIAMERGEVDGMCGVDISTFESIRPDWLAKRQVNMFVQIALEPNPGLTKLGIPSIWPFVPPENKAVVELIVSQQVFQRPFIAPPETPARRVQILRDAFEATMNDGDFLTDAANLKLSISPLGGAEVSSLVDRLYASPTDVVEQMAQAVR